MLFGVKFDKVSVKQNKLFVELNNVFEAVFMLNFRATNYEHPIVYLYDYKMHLPELRDSYHKHGKEF